MTYIHYGSDAFEPSLFTPIRNRRFEYDLTSVSAERREWLEDLSYQPKPDGGLWASRVDDPQGWAAWCRANGFNLGELDHSFQFELKPGCRVLEISSIEELAHLPMQKPWTPKDISWIETIAPDQMPTKEQLEELYRPNPCFLDFEQLVDDGVDALEIIDYPAVRDAFPLWDCNSLLVLNREVIQW